MKDLLRKRNLRNYNEKTIKKFLGDNLDAVMVDACITENGDAYASFPRAKLCGHEGKETILWGIQYLSIKELHKTNDIFLCKNYDEGKALFTEWCKLESTINEQKKILEKKISYHKHQISKFEEKLTKLNKTKE